MAVSTRSPATLASAISRGNSRRIPLRNLICLCKYISSRSGSPECTLTSEVATQRRRVPCLSFRLVGATAEAKQINVVLRLKLVRQKSISGSEYCCPGHSLWPIRIRSWRSVSVGSTRLVDQSYRHQDRSGLVVLGRDGRCGTILAHLRDCPRFHCPCHRSI
jgi:hypothetical protein